MTEKRFKKNGFGLPHPYEVDFGAGIPESTERENHDETFIYPEELIDKKCGGCVRCEPRTHGSKGGWHCCMRNYNIDITPEDKACVGYWDRAERNRAEAEHQAAIEARRKELWAIYAEKEPVELPLVYDGYGRIPKCPICGEMPYSTEQCHWCGQRYIQTAEVRDYDKPHVIDFTCPNCHKPGKANISKYNGHKHFRCEHCGFAFME